MTCPVCIHAKAPAINADLARQVSASTIATRYHITKKLIGLHYDVCLRAALVPEEMPPMIDDEAVVASSAGQPSMRRRIEAIERALHPPEEHQDKRPLALVQEGWQAAKDDQAERARIVQWINDQLQSDDMGL